MKAKKTAHSINATHCNPLVILSVFQERADADKWRPSKKMAVAAKLKHWAKELETAAFFEFKKPVSSLPDCRNSQFN